MVKNYEKAEQDYMNGMKYEDIAEKYNVTINTVKSWKKRYGWNRKKGAHKNEKCAHKIEKGCTQKTDDAHRERAPVDDGTKDTLKNADLTPEQQMFCIFYSRTFNATQSYMKAYGCKYSTALTNGPALLGNTRIKKEIERLKELKRQQIVAGPDDLVELQMRIAFADIGDYMTFGQEEFHDPETDDTYMISTVDLKESENTDTQLIQEVKKGKDGVSIKLADKQKAIDWLTKFFELNPDDRHRREFDKRKLDLELLKLEMQTKDTTDGVPDQDNFLEAMNATAEKVWSDG